MEKIFTNRWSIVVILGAIALTAFLIFQNAQTAVGSVDFESAGYMSTSTDSNFSAGTGKLLKTGSGILGSVVVTLGSSAPLVIYDATTTIHTDSATTTLVNFKTTATAGTYTFDVTFNKGLLIVGASSVGMASSTVTWK